MQLMKIPNTLDFNISSFFEQKSFILLSILPAYTDVPITILSYSPKLILLFSLYYFKIPSSARFTSNTLTVFSPSTPSNLLSVYLSIIDCTSSFDILLFFAIRST